MFEDKKSYNFATLAPTVLGGFYTNMKVIGIGHAVTHARDINTLHVSLKSSIPNLPETTNDCSYVLFENIDGEKLLLAREYIDMNTVELITGVNIRLEVMNVSTSDISILRNMCLELGYVNVQIKTF